MQLPLEYTEGAPLHPLLALGIRNLGYLADICAPRRHKQADRKLQSFSKEHGNARSEEISKMKASVTLLLRARRF